MARRTPPTAPAPAAPPPVPRLPSPTEGRRSGGGVTTADIDVDAERDAEGSLPEQLVVEHSDERSPEREEAERAVEARDRRDLGLDERLEQLGAALDEIHERLDEDDDEQLHYRDLGTEGLEYVDEQIAP